MPGELPFGAQPLVPLRAGESVGWRLARDEHRPWKAALDAPIFDGPAALALAPGSAGFPRHDELNALAHSSVVSGGGAPIRFVPPASAPGARRPQYEVRIFETGEVQTRPDNWHDLFNALVWLAFPKTKAVLNRHHRERNHRASRRARAEAPRATC